MHGRMLAAQSVCSGKELGLDTLGQPQVQRQCAMCKRMLCRMIRTDGVWGPYTACNHYGSSHILPYVSMRSESIQKGLFNLEMKTLLRNGQGDDQAIDLCTLSPCVLCRDAMAAQFSIGCADQDNLALPYHKRNAICVHLQLASTSAPSMLHAASLD